MKDLVPGTVITGFFAADRKEMGETSAQKPFLRCVFRDRTGEVLGVCWEEAEAVAAQFENGDVVKVRGRVGTYHEKLQLTVEKLRKASRDEVEPADYLPASRFSIEEMVDELRRVVGSVEDPWLRKLLHVVFSRPGVVERYSRHTAALGIHHAYVGGLLEHVLEMVRLVEAMAALHPEYTDRDLLVAGVLLHDIGKLEEYEMRGVGFNQSNSGQLLGHIYMGARWVEERIAEIEGFPASLRQELLHLILSHHGEIEFGAVSTPKTMNAWVLHMADLTSARLNQFRKLYDNHSTAEGDWTQYDRYLKTRAYLGFLGENSEPGAAVAGESVESDTPVEAGESAPGEDSASQAG